ncbi:hypothetical protein NA57DRAFT_62248 [Rhizodiscina lignyota]|uniref:Uncharacterized protein n=1 Tax=Rhizodiscina lignyota TaxID=1504668 RepID=A0A9P4M0V7_9PEZI|nr:hypothetical protein NA57DRAFT_62248 [Rhizodiscina lignyota]
MPRTWRAWCPRLQHKIDNAKPRKRRRALRKLLRQMPHLSEILSELLKQKVPFVQSLRVGDNIYSAENRNLAGSGVGHTAEEEDEEPVTSPFSDRTPNSGQAASGVSENESLLAQDESDLTFMDTQSGPASNHTQSHNNTRASTSKRNHYPFIGTPSNRSTVPGLNTPRSSTKKIRWKAVNVRTPKSGHSERTGNTGQVTAVVIVPPKDASAPSSTAAGEPEIRRCR